MDEADSFDMNEVGNEIAADVFGVKETEEVTEEVIQETTEEAVEEPAEEAIEVRSAPQSWKKEMHEQWGTLAPEVQDYIELREQQMREGIDVAKEDGDLGRSLRDIINPYKDLFSQQNVSEVDAIKYLLNAHHNLSVASPEDRVKLFNQMAQSYGVNLDGSKIDDHTQELNNRIQHLERLVSQSQQESQQEKQTKAMQEVDAFASEHEFFDDVAEELSLYVRAQREAGLEVNLQEAYEKAIWANPVTREKEIERLEKEKLEKLSQEKQEKAEKAQKAKSVNVKAKDTNKAPTGSKGKMFDDLPDLYDQIVNN